MRIVSQTISIVLAMLLVADQIPAQTAADLQIHVVDSDGNGAAIAGASSSKGFTLQVSEATGAAVADAAVVLRLPDSGASGTFTDGTHSAVGYTDEEGFAHLADIQWGATPGVVGIRVTATKGAAHAGVLFEETLGAQEAPLIAHARVPVNEKPAPAAVDQAKVLVASVVQAPQITVSARQPGTIDSSDRLPSPRTADLSGAPSVSVTNGPTGEKFRSGGGGKTKWIILALVAVGAGAGIALAMRGKSSSSSSSTSSGVSVGGPTVSVGAP